MLRPRGPAQAGDPHCLRRFTKEQSRCFEQALREVRRGRKSSCWMWHVVPTPPYIVSGRELGSSTNQRYAIRGEEEARAYLTFQRDGVNLRDNYLRIMRAVRDQLQSGISALSLLGALDEPKLVSSARFFGRLARACADEELGEVCREVLVANNMLPDDESQPLFPACAGGRPRQSRALAAGKGQPGRWAGPPREDAARQTTAARGSPQRCSSARVVTLRPVASQRAVAAAPPRPLAVPGQGADCQITEFAT